MTICYEVRKTRPRNFLKPGHPHIRLFTHYNTRFLCYSQEFYTIVRRHLGVKKTGAGGLRDHEILDLWSAIDVSEDNSLTVEEFIDFLAGYVSVTHLFNNLFCNPESLLVLLY